MEQKALSLWLAVTLGIAGLVAGYSLVIAMNSDTAFANGRMCPMKHAECLEKGCTADCPFNCHGKNV